MAVAGILGFAFVKFKFSSAALVLGLVLGGMTESNLRRAVSLANGDLYAVLSKPITASLLVLCALMLFYPIVSGFIKSKKVKATA